MTQVIEELIAEVEGTSQQIFELQQTIADKVNALNAIKQEAQTRLNDAIFEVAKETLKDKDYGCGTANIETPQFKIKTVVSKKIKWDETLLKGIAEQIKDAGQDPEVYIKYKLSVSETAYKDFPEKIQDVFTKARTVEPSAPKITYERK